jgi:hypothetical protein
MNIDAGIEAGDLGEHARGEAQFCTPESVGDAMNPDSPEAGIAEEDFETGARGRVALQHGVDVIADSG